MLLRCALSEPLSARFAIGLPLLSSEVRQRGLDAWLIWEDAAECGNAFAKVVYTDAEREGCALEMPVEFLERLT